MLIENGSAGGVFVTVLETTDRILRERRQRVVKDIAAIHAQGSREKIFGSAVEALAASPGDAPFSAVCGRSEGGEWTVIARSAPPTLSDNTILATLEQVQADSAPSSPVALLEHTVCAPWPESVTKIACRPILPPGAAEPAGIMVFGVSPRLRWDDEYSAFFDTCASSLATVIADAEAFDVERKRAEALAAIDRAKTAFFSNVSHEFRTPLTLMLGPLEEALEDATGDGCNERRRAQLETAHRNALRLQRLVNSLLDFSRIEAGRASVFFRPTELVQFTTDLVSSFRSATDKAGLDLVIDAQTLSKPVYIDHDMWENIVLNLVSNAFKFTLKGAIRVEIAPAREDRCVAVTVHDTGVGIPDHELPRLFERFHRVEGVTGRSIEGSGIGLALVQELVLAHGGDLTVRSDLGKGSAFTITLPFGKEHLPADRVSQSNEAPSIGHRYGGFVAEALRWLPGAAEKDLGTDDAPRNNDGATDQRILVVDDNADMRDYLRHLLQGHGYRVDVAADGLDALAMIERAAPDLVLSDLMMPRLDGFGLLARLRDSESTRELPFIALSARAGQELKIEGLNAGADDYLIKPFASRELFARVGSAIELARVRRQAREALQDEYARLRRLFEKAPGFMATLRGPDHVFEFANPAYLRIIGERDIIGKPVAIALPEIVDQGFIELLDEVYRTGKPYVGENVHVQLQQEKGAPPREVVVNFVYEPLTDPDGTVIGVFLEGHDVTPQHNANQHLQLLVSELNHRVKNMLAIVQSLSQQTFRGERVTEVERKAFEGRLTALASAHDLLTRDNWESPTLSAVAREVFDAHARGHAISISGPPVRLNPKTAVTLAMALHELCTNAVKYGALSVAGGSVALRWEIEQEPEPRLTMTWRERGGPTVEPPSRRGFGSRLIERALATELRGIAQLDFRSDGLVCQINAPLPE